MNVMLSQEVDHQEYANIQRPASIYKLLKDLAIYLQGEWLLSRLRIRHRELLRQFRPLAEHLEKDIFPFLQHSQTDRLTVSPNGDELKGVSAKQTFQFSKTPLISQFLQTNNINAIEFDVLLESNQILDSILLLLYCRDQLAQTPAPIRAQFSWDKRQIAAQLLSSEGVHKYCSNIRFNPETKTYSVKYSYCEMAFSRFVSSLINHRKKFQDHRVLFNASLPMAAITLFICGTIALLLYLNPSLALWIWMLASCFISIGVWLGFHTIGSLRYDREHRDQLIQKYVNKVSSLSRFPETNSNFVMKISSLGKILYCNPATKRLLEQCGFSGIEVDKILPSNIKNLIQSALSDCTNTSRTVQTKVQNRFIEYSISCFDNEPAVIVAGRDITYIHKMEEMLINANLNLEDKVEQRTVDLINTQDVTIMCLAGLAETRDPETGEHLHRTRLYVKILAEHLKHHPNFEHYLSDDRIEKLYKSAPLHDIGKVGVPDSILLKPGRLSDDEFEIMKKHTLYGGDTLQRATEQLGTDSFLKTASEIAYAHHERWDGCGYPKGLKGNEIPVSARLMSLADVYDALTSKRVYKEAFSHQKAKEIILDGKGSQFDPDIIEAFVELEAEFISIAQQYAN